MLKLEADEVTEAFNEHKAMMPWGLLRDGLENLCLTSSPGFTRRRSAPCSESKVRREAPYLYLRYGTQARTSYLGVKDGSVPTYR